MKSYCISCGEGTEYSLKKPSFCPSCGKSMGFAQATIPNIKDLPIIKTTAEDLVYKNRSAIQTTHNYEQNTNIDEENDSDNSNLFSNALSPDNPEEFLVGRRLTGITLGQIGQMPKTGFTRSPNEIPKAPKGKKAIAEWMKEAGKTSRPIEIDDNSASEDS